MCRCCPGRHLYKKNVGNFATSSVEGPEKTLRCRWGNSNPRIQYVRSYLAHTRISCGKFLRFSTKSEKQNVSVFIFYIWSTSVDTANLRHFIQANKYCRIFFRLFDFLGGAFNRLNLRVVLVPCMQRFRPVAALKNAKSDYRAKLYALVRLLQ